MSTTYEVNEIDIRDYEGCSTNISGRIRKVANLERLFLWSPECTVSMVTRINGNVSKERLHRAIFEVTQIHPLVGAKIVFDETHNGWFSTDNVPEPDLKIISRVSDIQWFEELQKEIHFDLL